MLSILPLSANRNVFSPRRIAVLHNDLRFGGVERQFINWANYVSFRQDLALVICKRKGELLAELDPDVEVIEIGDYPAARIDPVWLFRLFRVIKTVQPSVLFSLHGKFHWMAVLLRTPQRKVYLSQPGFFIKGRLFRVHRYFMNKADLIIPVSNHVGRLLGRDLGHPEKIRVIENTSSILHAGTPLWEKTVSETFRIVSVSRIDRNKNIAGILSAVAILRNDGIRIEYVILGDGPELENCKRWAQDLGIADHVSFLGFRQNTEHYIADSDLLILNSGAEGVPTVVLDAWALGILVLTNDFMGRDDDFIQDGVNGFVASENDPASLARKIKSVIDLDPARRMEIRRRAYNHFSQRFSRETYVARFEELLGSDVYHDRASFLTEMPAIREVKERCSR